MSKWIKTDQPCPCGDSNAYAIDVNGDGYCFRGGCEKYFKSGKESNIESQDIRMEYHAHRGISRATMEFYNVQTKIVNGVPEEVGFVLPNKAIQIKKLNPDVSKGKYRVDGPYGEAGCFGLDKFDAGSKDSITIVEGFHDCLAAHEMLMGHSAVISVKSSSSAFNDCKKDWNKINSFNKIVIAVDNDEPGKKAARDIASLFDFNKVYHLKLEKHKDANEYLENHEADSFRKAWKNARRFAPDNIISSFQEIENTLDKDQDAMLGTYQIKSLNSSLYGLFEGDVIVVKAPEGVGKTEFFRSLEYHLIQTTKHNIGIIHLEEDNATTIKAIAGYELSVPAVLPDCGLSKKDVMNAYKKALKDDAGRLHIYASFDVEDERAFLDNIRFLVSAAGCKFIFLDHISWLATGQDDDDERKKLDRISQKLKLLAKELRFCLIMISHVNDDGKTRGSRNISKVANTVLSLARDLTSYDTIVRNTTEILIEKARLGGRTGPGGRAMFNQETGKLEDIGSIS
jgi:twinkle protein